MNNKGMSVPVTSRQQYRKVGDLYKLIGVNKQLKRHDTTNTEEHKGGHNPVSFALFTDYRVT